MGDLDAQAPVLAEHAAPPIVVICRRGNNSQRAVVRLRELGVAAVDVIGGYQAWATEVDAEFSMY